MIFKFLAACNPGLKEITDVKINFINGDSTKIPLDYDHIITDLYME